MNTTQQIAIIGGGCAGLSAAAALVEHGYSVTVFEASSQLGGRARTVVVQNNDLMQLLDNGQHILLGVYDATRALLKKTGVNEDDVLLRQPLQIRMLSNSAKTLFSLKSINYLPAPLNLLLGFLFCRGLSLSERINALKFMRYLKQTHYEIISDRPLIEFFNSHQQSDNLLSYLWEPLCLAALNTPVSKASTRIFLNVLKDSFEGKKSNSDLLIPAVDLSQLLSHPLSNYIRTKGGVIKLNHRIRALEQADNGFNLETRSEKFTFSHVIVATSPARAGDLLQHIPQLKLALERTRHFDYQPIYTIYLQYPSDTRLPHAMTGLNSSLAQWVFDRGIICNQKGLLAVVVSAEGKHQKLKQDDLALRVAKELNRAFPHLTKPLWHKVIAEKRATFACTPNLTRPGNKTALPNLFLAGDYTYQDYPATIEGAVRSGIKCAELIEKSSVKL
ncbi:MAG: hydroxysqualene dehydroxylase HpnE [Methylotenera sp.]|nr:hydroxysqualene dehydroxylase HpnE [Methylotenera sp.]